MGVRPAWLRAPLAAVFSATGVAKDLLFLFCGPLALFWFFNGAIYVGNASCNNLKHPFVSTVVNWGRNTLGIVPTVTLFAGWYGPAGVLIGREVGGAVFAAISYIWVKFFITDRLESTAAAEAAPAAPAAPAAEPTKESKWKRLHWSSAHHHFHYQSFQACEGDDCDHECDHDNCAVRPRSATTQW